VVVVATPRLAEVGALRQGAEEVSPRGVAAALRLAVARPRQGAEEILLPVVPPQERPEDRGMDMGTERDRADTVDTAGSPRMGDTEEMEDMVVKT
jgi:hypothetical protein